jgi:hypothetical protein
MGAVLASWRTKDEDGGTILSMGGEGGSTALARLAGEICGWCKNRLSPPERPGERSCESCGPAHAPRRRVYMYFMERQGWSCQFLEADLKTALPRKLNLDDPAKLIEMAERGGGLPNREADQMLRYGIKMGRGGVWP